MRLRIGTRESMLAVRQAEMVAAAIREYDGSIECELVKMKTTGDRILDRTLDKIGGKGLFTRELDAALLAGDIDIAVHSGKDLPMELPESLPLVAFSGREDPRDVLILPGGVDEPDFSKPVGSSSARRALQLPGIYPGAQVAPVRGNLQTRLKKLDSGEYSALVLAAAGIKRLGLENRISRWFSTDEMLPAAAQGIIAVQAREGADTSYLTIFDDRQAGIQAMSERAFTAELDGGCSSPVAAFARLEGDRIHIQGMYVDEDNRVFKDSAEGSVVDAVQLARGLARKLLEEHLCQEK